MFAFLEKKILSANDAWNRRSQTLIPKDIRFQRSVILIHGFMGSPFDMKPLGIHLCNMGFKVVIPVLPGQTMETPVFNRKKYSASYYLNWLRQIIQRETDRTGQRPCLAGFSMGGALSAIMASENRVEKLSLIAPFFKLPQVSDVIWRVSGKLVHVIPFVPKMSKGRINSTSGYQSYRPGSCLISLGAFNTLGQLAMAGRQAAADIRVPTLIVISDKDQVADSGMTTKLFDHMPNVSFSRENRANHILLHDHGADEIIRRIAAFFVKAVSTD
jgi:carboxylesterase